MDIQRMERAVRNVVDRYSEAGYFPDAAVQVFDRAGSFFTVCAGSARKDSLFDAASLTKIATATQILLHADQGRLSLEAEVGELLPEISAHRFLRERLRGITIAALLTHTSTLPAWYPFYSRQGEPFWDTLSYALTHTEPAKGVVYSDLNYMILGKLLESVRHKSLEECLREDLVGPLGLGDMMYRPDLNRHIIPSDYGNAIEMNMCQQRKISFSGFRQLGIPVIGTVNDGNCHYYFNDVAGHAGIFASVESYTRLCQYYMNTSSALLLCAQKEQPYAPGRGLGFQTGMTYPYGCGHTGFTGTSIYFSREKNIGCTAFTNRLFYPNGNDHNLSEFRRALHEIVFAFGAQGL